MKKLSQPPARFILFKWDVKKIFLCFMLINPLSSSHRAHTPEKLLYYVGMRTMSEELKGLI